MSCALLIPHNGHESSEWLVPTNRPLSKSNLDMVTDDDPNIVSVASLLEGTQDSFNNDGNYNYCCPRFRVWVFLLRRFSFLPDFPFFFFLDEEDEEDSGAVVPTSKVLPIKTAGTSWCISWCIIIVVIIIIVVVIVTI